MTLLAKKANAPAEHREVSPEHPGVAQRLGRVPRTWPCPHAAFLPPASNAQVGDWPPHAPPAPPSPPSLAQWPQVLPSSQQAPPQSPCRETAIRGQEGVRSARALSAVHRSLTSRGWGEKGGPRGPLGPWSLQPCCRQPCSASFPGGPPLPSELTPPISVAWAAPWGQRRHGGWEAGRRPPRLTPHSPQGTHPLGGEEDGSVGDSGEGVEWAQLRVDLAPPQSS